MKVLQWNISFKVNFNQTENINNENWKIPSYLLVSFLFYLYKIFGWIKWISGIRCKMSWWIRKKCWGFMVLYIYLPLYQQDVTRVQFLTRSLTGLNCELKVKEPCQPFYLLTAGLGIVGFIAFYKSIGKQHRPEFVLRPPYPFHKIISISPGTPQ